MPFPVKLRPKLPVPVPGCKAVVLTAIALALLSVEISNGLPSTISLIVYLTPSTVKLGEDRLFSNKYWLTRAFLEELKSEICVSKLVISLELYEFLICLICSAFCEKQREGKIKNRYLNFLIINIFNKCRKFLNKKKGEIKYFTF
jgi:hypothetical protein